MDAETTSIQLLTSEGRACVRFSTVLNPVQYEVLLAKLPELMRIVEIRAFVRALARQWGCEASVVEAVGEVPGPLVAEPRA